MTISSMQMKEIEIKVIKLKKKKKLLQVENNDSICKH